MKKQTLSATLRTIQGRKVKNLRKSGMIPGSVYGKNVESAIISVNLEEFKKLYKETGESGLIELAVGGSVRPVLVHNVQRHPVDDKILHIEFYQVNLKEKVKANVSVVIIGVSPVVEQKIGTLLTLVSSLEVEALPAELPEHITVDVTNLIAINDEVTVSQLSVPSGVIVHAEPGLVLAKVSALVAPEAVAPAVEVAPVAAAGEETPVAEETEPSTDSSKKPTAE